MGEAQAPAKDWRWAHLGVGGDDGQGQIIVCKEDIKALIDPGDP